MALSSVSNWEVVPHEFNFNSEMIPNCFQQNVEAELLAGDFFHFCDQYSDYDSNFSTNMLVNDHQWYDPSNVLNLENHATTTDHLLVDPYVASHFTPAKFPEHDHHPFPNPKRQKCFEDRFYPEYTPAFSNVFAPNLRPLPELLPMPAFSTPLAKFEWQPEEALIDSTRPNMSEHENVGANKKLEEKTVSVQSIAARQRRRKISEKTQELGRLVPGGNKMNTAEMYTAAYNYVKVLQAQVGVLQLMRTFQEFNEALPAEELQVVASPIVQEKLYLENTCLVPKMFVEILAKHLDAKSKSSLANDLKQLLKSLMIDKKNLCM